MNLKNCRHLLLSVLIVFLTGQGSKPSAPPITAFVDEGCGAENQAFIPGEEIIYKIYYNLNPLWVSAGEISFKIEDVGSDYRFKVLGHSYKSLEWFYKGVYTFESLVDKKTLMPKQFVRTIQEKKFTEYHKFIFDQKTGKVTTWKGKTAEDAERKVQDIGECMHDMISVVYYLRNLNIDQMHVGDAMPVDIFLEKTYPLNVRIVGKNQEKRIKGMGKYKTHMFSPEVIAGDVFSEGTQMSVWISADDNKIPLMIESPLRVGNVKAVLMKQKGLRHTFATCE